MGQRHQAFAVARVVPHGETKPYYRCIAVIHHQWCYGRLPLRAARRCLTLIKQKDNAEIIREEIRLMKENMGDVNVNPGYQKFPVHISTFYWHQRGILNVLRHRAWFSQVAVLWKWHSFTPTWAASMEVTVLHLPHPNDT